MDQSKIKVILNQYFDETLDKFKKLSLKNKESPSNYDGNLWNKLTNLKNNGNLQNKYKKVLLSDQSTFNLIFNNKDKIINWANSNYFDPFIITKFIERLGKLYLSSILFKENKVFQWINNLKINYMKQLTTSTIEERIVRSFIYGKPFQFSFSKNKSEIPVSIINSIINPVKFKETLIESSNEMIFFLNYYNEFEDLTESAYLTSILSKIDLDWLIPAIPLFMNKLLDLDLIIVGNTKIIYANSEFVQQIKRKILNNWNKNKVLWNSENLPIMKHFYNNISRILSTNSL
jgi:hypothetical protein